MTTLLRVTDVEEGGLIEVEGAGSCCLELLGNLLTTDRDRATNGVLGVGDMGSDVGENLGVVTESFGNHEVMKKETISCILLLKYQNKSLLNQNLIDSY